MPKKTLDFPYNLINLIEAIEAFRTDIYQNELLVVPGQNNTYRVKLHLLAFGSTDLRANLSGLIKVKDVNARHSPFQGSEKSGSCGAKRRREIQILTY